ncbi:MAG: hypothetical protein ACXVAY_01495 [Mucilaginibacter sp.]
MKTYILTCPRFTGELIFGYNHTGQLIRYENKTSLDHKGNAWLLKWFPTNIMELMRLKAKIEGKLEEVKP